MTFTELKVMEVAAWRAFYEVLKTHGVTKEQLDKIKWEVEAEDIYYAMTDCLVEGIGGVQDDE